jgi:hypothetical protein
MLSFPGIGIPSWEISDSNSMLETGVSIELLAKAVEPIITGAPNA